MVKTNKRVYMVLQFIKQTNAKLVESYFAQLVKLANYCQEPPHDAFLTTFFMNQLTNLFTVINASTFLTMYKNRLIVEGHTTS
jgi:hypothetical protein